MATLFGRLYAPNVQKVLWLGVELGLTFDRIDVGGPFGGLDEPAYLDRNPTGTIPTLDDDGFVLWESNAILRYYARQFPDSGLYPLAPRDAAIVDQWMEWQNSALGLRVKALMVSLNRPGTPEEVVVRAGEELVLAMAIIDGQLTRTPFLAGQTFTLADIAVGIGIHRWLHAPVERPRLPAIAAWYERIGQRPSFAAVREWPMK